jgi:hypothetical protein
MTVLETLTGIALLAFFGAERHREQASMAAAVDLVRPTLVAPDHFRRRATVALRLRAGAAPVE